jgi:hypothetical protein
MFLFYNALERNFEICFHKIVSFDIAIGAPFDRCCSELIINSKCANHMEWGFRTKYVLFFQLMWLLLKMLCFFIHCFLYTFFPFSAGNLSSLVVPAAAIGVVGYGYMWLKVWNCLDSYCFCNSFINLWLIVNTVYFSVTSNCCFIKGCKLFIRLFDYPEFL